MYTLVIRPADDGGYWGECAELPEVNGQGKTREACMEDLKECIRFVLECRRDEARSHADAQTEFEVVEV